MLLLDCEEKACPIALELKLQKLEHGLAMPRDEYAIAETKAMLEQARLEHEGGNPL